MNSSCVLQSVGRYVQTFDLDLPLPSTGQPAPQVAQWLTEFSYYGLLFAAVAAFVALLFGSIVLFRDARRTDPVQSYLQPVPPKPIHRYPRPMGNPSAQLPRKPLSLTPTRPARHQPGDRLPV
ncbi:hypothetical protein [Spirosoma koreense]